MISTRTSIAVASALVALVAATAGLALVDRKAAPSDYAARSHPALAVQTLTVQQQQAFSLNRVFSGHAQARRDSLLGFEQAGRLASVAVEEGSAVRRGQLLARIDTQRLRARRAELEAQLAQSEANLALAEATLRRRDRVVQAGGVSRQLLDEAQEDLRVAEASVALARRRIDSLAVEFDKTRLVAPFDGVIIARLADEGRVLEAGTPILRLQSNAAPEIRIGVAGRSIEALRAGDEYVLRWRGQRLTTRLRTVLPVRSEALRTVDALFDALAAPAGFRPGDLVTLSLAVPVHELGVWLPVTALAEGERGLWSVYVTESLTAADSAGEPIATHRIVRRTVDVIHQEADRVYARGALRDHDKLVSTGVQRVVPGQRVRLAQAVAGPGGSRQ